MISIAKVFEWDMGRRFLVKTFGEEQDCDVQELRHLLDQTNA
jgi:hypothetical protein